MSFIATVGTSAPIITNVVNAGAANYTLTAKATIVKTVPTGYGQTVTLPSALLLGVGGAYFVVDNSAGAYPILIRNANGDLVSFVFAGVTATVTLINASTVAGVWDVLNGELVGASAQLLTANLSTVNACIDIGSNQELLLGYAAGTFFLYGVVYNRSTNTFGSVTLIRSANVAGGFPNAVLSATNQVLVVSNSGTAFEAVTLTISGTAITVNTAATATLSATFSAWADGCGLIAVGSSFVTSYRTATPTCEIRALSVSGITVTIGAASTLTGSKADFGIVASASIVIAVSALTTNIYTQPYTVSGSTLTLGTGTTTSGGAMTLKKLFAMGTGRFFCGYTDATNGPYGAFISISGTTTTISTVQLAAAVLNFENCIQLTPLKVLCCYNTLKIVTDNGSGIASAGTAAGTFNNSLSFLYVDGTTVLTQTGGSGATPYLIERINCSGTSPILIDGQTLTTTTTSASQNFGASNLIGTRSENAVYGSALAQSLYNSINVTTSSRAVRVKGGIATNFINYLPCFGDTRYRGKLDSERWLVDGAKVITKLECVI